MNGGRPNRGLSSERRPPADARATPVDASRERSSAHACTAVRRLSDPPQGALARTRARLIIRANFFVQGLLGRNDFSALRPPYFDFQGASGHRALQSPKTDVVKYMSEPRRPVFES